jgi:hypothetical protein
MWVKNSPFDGTRDDNCTEEPGGKIGLAGGNEIGQGRGVRHDYHYRAPNLPRAVGESFEHSGFTVELARVVIIEIKVLRQEVLGLGARETEELADLKLS